MNFRPTPGGPQPLRGPLRRAGSADLTRCRFARVLWRPWNKV